MGKRSRKGQINFFRVMAAIGVVVVILIVNEFLDAAPPLPTNKVHKGPPSVRLCLDCHVTEVKKVPIMPHRPMDNCTFCHKPSKTTN